MITIIIDLVIIIANIIVIRPIIVVIIFFYTKDSWNTSPLIAIRSLLPIRLQSKIWSIEYPLCKTIAIITAIGPIRIIANL